MEVTWVGHATALVVVDGVRFLTDPALTSRLAHLRRHIVADVEALAPDVVLISHLHVDHLHLASLRLLTRDRSRPVTVVVPAGAASLVRRAGFAAVHRDPRRRRPPLRVRGGRDGPRRALRLPWPAPPGACGRRRVRHRRSGRHDVLRRRHRPVRGDGRPRRCRRGARADRRLGLRRSAAGTSTRTPRWTPPACSRRASSSPSTGARTARSRSAVDAPTGSAARRRRSPPTSPAPGSTTSSTCSNPARPSSSPPRRPPPGTAG